jgi:hypothetical protein
VFPGNFKPLTAPDPLHTIRANLPTGLVQQSCNPAIAITAICGCKLKNGLCQGIFVRTDNSGVTLRTTWLADEPAGVTLGELILLPGPDNRLPTPFGAYKFPEAISFKTCFSSERSATRRLRWAFSRSRPFMRFACST